MSRPSNVSKSSLVNSLAKRYDPKALQNQGPVTAKKTPQPQPVCNHSKTPVNLNNTMDTNLEILNQKMDNVLMTQNNVVEKLDNIMQDIGGIERDIEFMKSDTTKTEHVSERSKDKVKMSDIKELFVEMITNLSSINKYAEHQAQKLHGVEQILLGAQNVIHFIMEEMKIKEMFTFVQKKETPLKPVIVGNKIRKEETEIQKQRGEMKGVKKNVKTRDSTRKWKSCLNGKKIKVNKDQINEKKNWRLKGTKSLKKKKPPDSDQTAQRNQSYTYDEKVQKLNQENLEKATVILVNSSPPESCPEEKSCISVSIQSRVPTPQGTPINISEGKEHISASPYEYSNAELLDNICVECTGHYSPDSQEFEGKTKPGILFDESDENIDSENEYDEEIEDEIVEKEDKSDLYAEEEEEISLKDCCKTTDNTATTHDVSQCPEAEEVEGAESVSSESDSTNVTLALPEKDVSQTEPSSNSKRRVPDETLIKDDTKKSRVDTEDTEVKTDKTKDVEEITINLIIPDKEPEEDHSINDKKDQSTYEEENVQFSFDVSPSPPAPFTHRIVSAKHAQINHFYTVDTSEMLGGGRYGQVHRCAEKNSGLSLAAKIIKVKSHKEKEEVKNEIQVMNQLNHVNLIQLYDAFESRNDIVLVMEYVEGGELFDRIIDEKYNLSETDTIQFIKQILEGIQYMHQMYIVHLDLKPENIMCVSRTAYQVKIIDFGLARRYKPREKLKVHFGTPEFLAPEVVNYDYVSFPTDMWSVGVITFMLLSGLSPFLGEDDNETLNNILACQFDFEGDEFENISEPAKDFIAKLLIKEKCWRMSATEALKHQWISDSKLHYRISQQAYRCVVSAVNS